MKNRIKEIRAERGMSQERLANMCGINRVTLAMIENNKAEPASPTIRRLVQVLELSSEDIFPELGTQEDGESVIHVGNATNYARITDSRERLALELVNAEQRGALEAVEKMRRLIGTFEMSFSKEQNALFAALFDMMSLRNCAADEQRMEAILEWMEEERTVF